jgi:hypothetical protein
MGRPQAYGARNRPENLDNYLDWVTKGFKYYS